MATKFLIFFFPLFASFFLQCNCCCQATEQPAGLGIQGMFVFGSSIVDNGNNNFLKAREKANYLPYGIDFPGGPSGRFSNGKNMIDILTERLQLPGMIPPSADPSTTGRRIVHGVDLASGGSGILDNTGSDLIGPPNSAFSLNKQMKHFENVILPELEAQLGCKSSDLLSKYLFVFGAGGNDYSYNYFIPKFNVNVHDVAFAINLTNALAEHIKKLYSLGGRKFVLMAIYPIGCTPVAKTLRPLQTDCLEDLNQAVQLFNDCLKSMVDRLKLELPGSSYVYVNQNKIIADIINNPFSLGFKEVRTACCEKIPFFAGGNGVACMKDGKVCGNRSDYTYFDGLHPTEAVNIQIANKAFASTNKDEAYPINVNQLATL